MRAIELLCPVWPAPANIVAGVTTRVGGLSKAPFSSLNLARHVNDANQHVTSNRAQLKRFCRTELCDPLARSTPPLAQRWHWLNQTHSNRVIDLASLGERAHKQLPDADAALTSMQQQVCVVLSADCLPILLCDQNGTRVCAIHAGWRGLLDGVIDNAVHALCALAAPTSKPTTQPPAQQSMQQTMQKTTQQIRPDQLLAWLGPAIGPCHFIVGDDVRQRARAYFGRDGAAEAGDSAFATLARDHSGDNDQAGNKYTADIYQLATLALHRLGVKHIYGGGFCTASDPQRFFSYRRDGQTGRMASFILLNGNNRAD